MILEVAGVVQELISLIKPISLDTGIPAESGGLGSPADIIGIGSLAESGGLGSPADIVGRGSPFDSVVRPVAKLIEHQL